MNQYTTPREHRDSLAEKFVEAFKAKYDKGQQEHGGELYRKDCSAFAEEEVLDFWAYLKTSNEQRAAAVAILERVERYPQMAIALCAEALDVLRGTKVDNA